MFQIFSAIILPSDQYYLEVADKTIANLDTETSTVTALKYGSTSVIVKDRCILPTFYLLLMYSTIYYLIFNTVQFCF